MPSAQFDDIYLSLECRNSLVYFVPNQIKSKLIRMDYIFNVCEIHVTPVKGMLRAVA